MVHAPELAINLKFHRLELFGSTSRLSAAEIHHPLSKHISNHEEKVERTRCTRGGGRGRSGGGQTCCYQTHCRLCFARTGPSITAGSDQREVLCANAGSSAGDSSCPCRQRYLGYVRFLHPFIYKAILTTMQREQRPAPERQQPMCYQSSNLSSSAKPKPEPLNRYLL